jgi:alkylation response protein AidB-like acyl-CoA dehydrogenase
MTHPHGAYLPTIKERHSAGAERLRNSVADWSAALAAVSDMPSSVRQDVLDALELAQRFNAEVVRPLALQWDRYTLDHPQSLPHELIRAAGEWGLFTVWLPTLFGGKGWNFISLYAFLEEVASACAGMAAMIGVHYMGLATLTASWHLKLTTRVTDEVCAGERRGQPCLISLALNEVHAGSDVTDTALLNQAQLVSQAVRQADGSYVLRGRKQYISDGHMAAWHMVVAYEDLGRGADTMVLLAVRADSPGVRAGEVMDKLGQTACVASELIFEDVHVPADFVAMDRHLAADLNRPYREVAQALLDYVAACTRAGVGAFSAGLARGAFESARDYAARKVLPQGRLIEQQWAQTTLADMHKNATMARQAYLESALANGMGGLFRTMFLRPLYWADQLAPAGLWRFFARRVMRSPDATQWFQRRFLAEQSRAWLDLVSGLASMAKFGGADLAMANAHLAMDLCGADALRHDVGIEKRLRDAKLLQILEGTDQINRVNLFKCRVRPEGGVRVFAREDEASVWPDLKPGWPEGGLSSSAVPEGLLAELPPLESLSARLTWLQARGGADLSGVALCRVLEALGARQTGAATMMLASAMAHDVLRAVAPPGGGLPIQQELAGQWLAWPAFHGLHDQLWPAVDAQGYLRGQVDMLVLGGQARWAVLPVQGRDQRMQLAVVDLGHPAVIRSEPVRTLGLSDGDITDVEFGGVPCEILPGTARGLYPVLTARWAAPVLALQSGVARGALEDAIAHAQARRQGGGSLLGWGEVRRLLAGMVSNLKVMQGLLRASLDEPATSRSALFQVLHAGELACRLTSDALQVHGGEGYRRHSAPARRLCDARQLHGLLGLVAWRRVALLDPS